MFTLEDDWEPFFVEDTVKPDLMFQKWFNLGTPEGRSTDREWHGRDRI